MKLIDKAIRDSLIIDSISDMIWEMDYTTREVHFSDSWREFLGYDEDEFTKNPDFWYLIIHPGDLPNVTTSLREHISGKTSIHSVKYRIKTRHNGYKWVLGRAKAYRNDDNKVNYVAGFHIDITDHMELVESKDKYKTVINSVNDTILLVRVDKETLQDAILEVNDAGCELLGYTKEELIGKSVNFFKPPELHSETLTNIKKALSSDSYFFHSNFISKNKGHITVEVNTRTFYRNGEQLKLSVIRDITDKINAEKTIKLERERNQNIVELSPNGVYMHINGKFTFANNKGVELLKAGDMSELIGKNALDFLHSDFKERSRERKKIIQAGGAVEPVEVLVTRMDGSTFTGELSTTYLPSDCGTLALSYLRDITSMKNILGENKLLLNQALEYDKLKTEFFANISHELRTPLNIILSSIQLLNSTYDQCNDKRGKCYTFLSRYIDVMKQNSYRLLKLINNLIDITRIDAGFYNINLKNHNIVQVIEDVTLSVVPYVENRGIQLTFDTDFEEKIMASDDDKMERIILNLLSNAIKFTSPGGKIKVNLGEKDDKLILTVKDTGSGIPQDKLDLIFERFRQADEVLTKRAEGSGIGLSLVKALVEAHSGSIRVTSQMGVGTEFLIEIPIKLVESEASSKIITDLTSLEKNKIERINIELADIDL